MANKQLKNNMSVYVIIDKRTGEIHHSSTNPWYSKTGAARNGLHKIPEFFMKAPDGMYPTAKWGAPDYYEQYKNYEASKVRVEVRSHYEIRKATITVKIGEVI